MKMHPYIIQPTRQGLTNAIMDFVPYVRGVSIVEKRFTFRMGLKFAWWVRFVPFLSRYLKGRAVDVLDSLVPVGIRFTVRKGK